MDSPALTSAHSSSSGKGSHSNLNDRGKVREKLRVVGWVVIVLSVGRGGSAKDCRNFCVEKLLSIKEAIKTPSEIVVPK